LIAPLNEHPKTIFSKLTNILACSFGKSLVVFASNGEIQDRGTPMLIETTAHLTNFLLLTTTALGSVVAWRNFSVREKLQKEIQNSRQTIENLHEGFYRTSLEGKQLSANPALVRLNGYSTEQELLEAVQDIGIEWYVDPNRRDEFKRLLNEKGKVTDFVSQIYRHKTRERIWISENARLVFDPKTHDPMYYEGTVRDITDEVKLSNATERLKKLASNLPGGLFQLVREPDGKFHAPYVSESFLKLMDRGADFRISNPNDYLKFIVPEDLVEYLGKIRKSGDELTVFDHQFRYNKSENRQIWLHITATPEKAPDGAVIWHGHINDITSKKLSQLEVEKLAFVDSLTGLPKRSVMDDRLARTITACNRREEMAAFIFLDLDNFKTLNDNFGHEAGDLLLQKVAVRLQGLVRASDMVSRFGGDEFVILIDNLGSEAASARTKAIQFAKKIISAFHASFDLNGHEHYASPSIGIALIESDQPTAQEITSRADGAMYRAKKNGRNTYVLHDDSELAGNSNIAQYERDLVGAVERGEFELMLQPQINARGKACGAEAFLRWNHPVEGTVMPLDFVPVAERTGLIVEINNWVIDKAISLLGAWKDDPVMCHLGLAVNVGVQQFSTANFAADLEAKLFKSGIDRSLLTIELTEGVMNRGIANVRKRMEEIKKCGVRFSLDDFGTGSSSLSNLNHLPFDEVKIDGSFVTSIEVEAENRSLIEGILGIARALELETVAEHVSSQFQEKYLRDRGCHRFQGYHYYPPLKLDEFVNIAKQSANTLRLATAG
jgi:diguanylate cyclase (GGDEF)-like protein/PAS domain S-box-containing protein